MCFYFLNNLFWVSQKKSSRFERHEGKCIFQFWVNCPLNSLLHKIIEILSVICVDSQNYWNKFTYFIFSLVVDAWLNKVFCSLLNWNCSCSSSLSVFSQTLWFAYETGGGMEGCRKRGRFGIVWMMRLSISNSEKSLKALDSQAQRDPCSAVMTGKVYNLKEHSPGKPDLLFCLRCIKWEMKGWTDRHQPTMQSSSPFIFLNE